MPKCFSKKPIPITAMLINVCVKCLLNFLPNFPQPKSSKALNRADNPPKTINNSPIYYLLVSGYGLKK